MVSFWLQLINYELNENVLKGERCDPVPAFQLVQGTQKHTGTMPWLGRCTYMHTPIGVSIGHPLRHKKIMQTSHRDILDKTCCEAVLLIQ